MNEAVKGPCEPVSRQQVLFTIRMVICKLEELGFTIARKYAESTGGTEDALIDAWYYTLIAFATKHGVNMSAIIDSDIIAEIRQQRLQGTVNEDVVEGEFDDADEEDETDDAEESVEDDEAKAAKPPLLAEDGQSNVLKFDQSWEAVPRYDGSVLTNTVIHKGPVSWTLRGCRLSEVAVGVVSAGGNGSWWYYHELMGHYRELMGVKHENLNVDCYHQDDTVTVSIDEQGTMRVKYLSTGGGYATASACVLPFPVIPAVNFTKTCKQFGNYGVEVSW